jgi:hypothetical protein
MHNRYQLRKARAISGVLVLAAAASDTPMSLLPVLAAQMSHENWITVSLQAGVPVADHAAKVLTVALLGNLV